jgi:hypothetical protein
MADTACVPSAYSPTFFLAQQADNPFPGHRLVVDHYCANLRHATLASVS